MAFSSVTCSGCKKDFLKENRHIHENTKLHHRFYCSSACLRLGRLKQVNLVCELSTCGKKFSREISGVSAHNFCSHSCRAIYANYQRAASKPKKQCLNCGKDIKKGKSYCSAQCNAIRFTIPKDKLLDNLKDLAKKLNRSPSRREFQQHTSCVKYFGSWSNALIQAGLQPNRSLNQRMYKRRVCFAHDGHPCNSVSEMIVDNWLHEHSIPHQKEVPYPIGKSVADWLIGNDIFVEYFGLATDSRRYDIAIEKKRRACREAGVQLIEIFSKDLFPKNNLDSLFKDFSF